MHGAILRESMSKRQPVVASLYHELRGPVDSSQRHAEPWAFRTEYERRMRDDVLPRDVIRGITQRRIRISTIAPPIQPCVKAALPHPLLHYPRGSCWRAAQTGVRIDPAVLD